jgi:hypothetical protein
MRWTRQRRVRTGSQGRLRSVSGRPARQTNGADAYGKTVWSWHPLLVSSRRRCCEPNRARKTFNPLTTVTRRIRRRGEHGISRKTIAQGRRNAPTVPVCSCALAIVFCTRDRGCSKHPAFPAPSSLGAKRFARPGRKVSRECGGVFCRHCERRRTPPPFEASAALRHLRVTATRERHPCARVTRERHPEVRASCEPRRMARAASAS